MRELLNYPLGVFAVSLVVLGVSIWAGGLERRRRFVDSKGEEADLTLITSASLTLLALIIGFSFSMAVSRYDLRKNYEEEEANAIGTEYVRTDILPAADAEKVRNLLRQYLDQRLLFYEARDPRRLEQVDNETTRLQAEMWSRVQTAVAAQQTAPMALVLGGMNDVLNRQGYTQAAWWNRIPEGAWLLMFVLAIICCVLTGYSAHRTGILMIAIFPFLVAVAFFLIADIDSPRRGVIRVAPHNLISLAQSLR